MTEPIEGAVELEALRGVVEKLIAWTEKYPSSRVYSYERIRTIGSEIDAITEEGRAHLLWDAAVTDAETHEASYLDAPDSQQEGRE